MRRGNASIMEHDSGEPSAPSDVAETLTSPLRVLIVEDEPDDAELVLRELRRGGISAIPRRIMTASELRDALTEAEWDLVLADYQLPQFGAPAALGVLKSTGLDLPFIVVSGTLGEDAAVEVLRAGAHDFLVKGRLARLVPAIQRELREARQRAVRRQAEALLHFSQQRLRMLVEGVHDHAMLTLDAFGSIQTWNPAAERILGYSEGEIVGQHYTRFFTPDDLAARYPMTLLDQAALTGRVEATAWRIRRDGSRFWADTVVTALRDQGGQLVGYSDITRDCTERRLVEEQRKESLRREQLAREEAEAAVRARDEFLSIASHELRNPVTSVRISAQHMLRLQNHGTLTGERLQTSLLDLDRTASRLATLTEDLLDVARLQDGRLPIRPTRLDLAELVAGVTCVYREGMPPTHELMLVAPAGACWTDADRGRLEQVVTNLLENAIKYSPAGGTVLVGVSELHRGWLVRVADEGIGLPPGSTELIFEAFGRAANSRSRGLPGMGLGLYICRQIAEAHGGRMWAESPGVDQGTAIHLWLPDSSSSAER